MPIKGTSKYKSVEQEVIDWYLKGEPIKDIVEANGLQNDVALYSILRKHNIPLRKRNGANGHVPDARSAPARPAREWYLMDECSVITGMPQDDIEWLIRKGAVHADTGETATGGKFTLVYLPSLVDAKQHAGIDGKRARELLAEAWQMIDRVAGQRAISIDDAKWIAKSIAEFFACNGWKLP